MKTIHYGNSSDKQKEYIESRIQQEIYCLANEDVEYILSSEDNSYDKPFTFEDIENMYTYTYNGEHLSFCNIDESERDDILDDAEDRLMHVEEDEDKAERLSDEIDEVRDLESEPQDIMQYFYVSNWLADKLYAENEPVIRRSGSPSIWGRTCCGQAISLDPTFWDIFQDSLKDMDEGE